jgi:hypothetical protein
LKKVAKKLEKIRRLQTGLPTKSGGWVGAKAVLWIAYSNLRLHITK